MTSNARWEEHLRPLGASFGGRFWPVRADLLAQVEATLGWELPADYRSFMLETGLTGMQGRRISISPTVQEGVHVGVIYGHHRRDTQYSIVALADQFLEPEALLQFAGGDAGVFFMDRSGAVHYESNWEAGLHRIAGSFTDFMDSIVYDG